MVEFRQGNKLILDNEVIDKQFMIPKSLEMAGVRDTDGQLSPADASSELEVLKSKPSGTSSEYKEFKSKSAVPSQVTEKIPISVRTDIDHRSWLIGKADGITEARREEREHWAERIDELCSDRNNSNTDVLAIIREELSE